MTKRKKRGAGVLYILREVISVSIYVLAILVLTWFVLTFIGQKTIVSGSSMESTLSDQDHIIVDKLSYRFAEPERYDIIVFPYPQEPDKLHIKRIIGLPGETVELGADGVIMIDGRVLGESYGREVIAVLGRLEQPVVLGEDEYFVLGDNRNDSQDSRDVLVGNVKRDAIAGKAWVRIWPFERIGRLRHQ